MKAGFATADITPPIGTWLNGFIARVTPSTGVDAPLTARALWLEDEGSKCLIVSLDVLGLSTAYADRLTGQLANRLNLPEPHIVIACTHNHSGPMSCRLRGIGPADKDYLRKLEMQVQQAAATAMSNQRAVEVAWGSSPLEISINRRQIDPATGKSVLGLNPSGPTDRAVQALQLRGDGITTVLFSYTCHPYCVGPEDSLISPDFPGYAVAALEARGIQSLFLNGCCGDIAPKRSCEGFAAAKQVGEQLADAVMAACRSAKVDAAAKLQADSVRFSIAHDRLPAIDTIAQELTQADNTVRPEDRQNERVVARVQAAWQEWLQDLRELADRGQPLPSIPTRASLVRIGQGAIVALPGELFYEIGQRIAARFSSHPVWVAAFCHGYIGYVPASSAYSEGGYEVEESHRFVSLWRVSPETEQTMAEQVDCLQAKLNSK